MLKLKDGLTYKLTLLNSKQDYNNKVPKDEIFLGCFQSLSKSDGKDGFWCTTLDKTKTLGYMLEVDVRVIELEE